MTAPAHVTLYLSWGFRGNFFSITQENYVQQFKFLRVTEEDFSNRLTLGNEKIAFSELVYMD